MTDLLMAAGRHCTGPALAVFYLALFGLYAWETR